MVDVDLSELAGLGDPLEHLLETIQIAVWGTLIGIVFIGVIINGMTLLDIPIYTQYVVRGLLIFAAVLINRFLIARPSGRTSE